VLPDVAKHSQSTLSINLVNEWAKYEIFGVMGSMFDDG